MTELPGNSGFVDRRESMARWPGPWGDRRCGDGGLSHRRPKPAHQPKTTLRPDCAASRTVTATVTRTTGFPSPGAGADSLGCILCCCERQLAGRFTLLGPTRRLRGDARRTSLGDPPDLAGSGDATSCFLAAAHIMRPCSPSFVPFSCSTVQMKCAAASGSWRFSLPPRRPSCVFIDSGRPESFRGALRVPMVRGEADPGMTAFRNAGHSSEAPATHRVGGSGRAPSLASLGHPLRNRTPRLPDRGVRFL
jgi:hypothetical protein